MRIWTVAQARERRVEAPLPGARGHHEVERLQGLGLQGRW